MFTGNKRRVFISGAAFFAVFLAASSWASPCVISDPPETLGDLFTQCEKGANFANYRTGEFEESCLAGILAAEQPADQDRHKVFESAITLSIIVYGPEFETNPTLVECE